MAHPEPAVRKGGILRLRVLTKAAAQLGIPLVTLCTGTRDRENMWRAHRDNGSPAAWADLLETTHGALTAAAEAGVALAIEPEHGNVVFDADRARALLDTLRAGDRLRIILDPANLWAAERPQRDILQGAFRPTLPVRSSCTASRRPTPPNRQRLSAPNFRRVPSGRARHAFH